MLNEDGGPDICKTSQPLAQSTPMSLRVLPRICLNHKQKDGTRTVTKVKVSYCTFNSCLSLLHPL